MDTGNCLNMFFASTSKFSFSCSNYVKNLSKELLEGWKCFSFVSVGRTGQTPYTPKTRISILNLSLFVKDVFDVGLLQKLLLRRIFKGSLVLRLSNKFPQFAFFIFLYNPLA